MALKAQTSDSGRFPRTADVPADAFGAPLGVGEAAASAKKAAAEASAPGGVGEAAAAAAGIPHAGRVAVAPAPPHRAGTIEPGHPREAAAPPPPPTAPPVGATPPRAPSPWPDRFKRWGLALAGLVYRAMCRPRVRLTVIGAVLLLIGAVFVTSSVWTLPLVIVGVGMLLIAWIGSRLDGRFAVEWGETGTQLEFRAQIKAPVQPTHPVALTKATPAPAAAAVADPEPEDAEVIEGDAHTIEIDVDELKALIAAAEAEERAA